MNIKILSINQSVALAGLDIAANKDILIPCNMFTISVPKENRTLDIISETVFRFCKYNRDYKRIAEKCCIDEELVKFIQNKLQNNGYLDDKFKNREGYYSWSGLRYFLFEYEQSLQSESRGNTAKINWLEFQRSKKDFVSIEHILPQKPSEECW